MFCPNCGKEIKDDAKFCKYCGTATQSAAEQPLEIEAGEESVKQLVKKGKNKKMPVWILLGILLLCIALSFVSIPGEKETNSVASESETQQEEDEVSILLKQAEEKYKNNEFEESISLLEEALKLHPDSEDIYVLISDIYLEQNEISKGIETIDRGITQCTDTTRLEERKEVILENIRIVCKYSYGNNKELFNKRTFEYDEEGNLVKEVNYDPNRVNSSSEYEYDEAGNQVSSRNYFDYGFGSYWTNYKREYDESGNTIEETTYNAEGKILESHSYKYDPAGRKIEHIKRGENNIMQSIAISRYEDGTNGRLLETVSYDENNAVIDRIVYEYQNEGKIESWTRYVDGGKYFSSCTTEEYDEQGKLIKKKFQDGKTSEWEYFYNEYDDVIKEIHTYIDDTMTEKDVSEITYEYEYQYIEKK